MSIYKTILSDLKTAMINKDAERLNVLRSLKASIQQKEISERKGGEGQLSDEQVNAVLIKAAKQRKESIDQYEKYKRDDLADTEKKELKIIESYLPKMMTEDEIQMVVKEIIITTGATSPRDMGKVMGLVMGKLKGKADGALINKVVKEQLNS
ncbi:MAG: GatB/YqeY domain-containing protein [Candidatus Paceibacterota bacterium]